MPVARPVITGGGAGETWDRTPVYCMMTQDTAQTGIANTTSTPITWDTKVAENGASFTTASGGITIPSAGIYLITSIIYVAAVAADFGLRCELRNNVGGAPDFLDCQGAQHNDGTATGPCSVQGQIIIALAENDVVTSSLYHNRGSDIVTLVSDAERSSLFVLKLA